MNGESYRLKTHSRKNRTNSRPQNQTERNTASNAVDPFYAVIGPFYAANLTFTPTAAGLRVEDQTKVWLRVTSPICPMRCRFPLSGAIPLSVRGIAKRCPKAMDWHTRMVLSRLADLEHAWKGRFLCRSTETRRSSRFGPADIMKPRSRI